MMAKNVKTFPKWMLKTSKANKDNISGEINTKSSESESRKKRLRKTIYCLTEKELLDTAVESLIQAGKEDLLQEIKSQKTNAPHESGKPKINKKKSSNCKSVSEKNASSTTELETRISFDSSPDLFSEKEKPKKHKPDRNNSCEKIVPKKHKPDLSILDEIFL